MQDKSKTELFENMPIPNAVMKLSIPTVLSSLVMVIYNLADTYFVGMLNDPIQNAAVTLAAPVLLAFNAVNNLFGVGTSSMMSRALGRKDYDTVYRSSAFGFWCSVLCGFMFSLLFTLCKVPLLSLLGSSDTTSAATGDYLFWTVTCGAMPAILNVVLAYLVRSEGASMHAGIGTMSGCALNILLDPIFILPWGLNLGAAGAGMATFLSNCAACLYFFILLFVRRNKTFVCVKPEMALPRKSIVSGICAVGIPASIQNLLNVTGMTFLNNMTAGFGADAVAAMGISHRVTMVPMQIAMGLSQGIMPLVSYNYASGNIKRMKDAITFTLKISISALFVVMIAYFCGARELINLFMKNEAILDYGTVFIRAMCFSLPFLGLDFTAVGIFQACGMGSKAFLFAVMRKIVLEIPFIFLLNKLFPLIGLAWSQTCAEAVLGSIAVLVLIGLFRKLEDPRRRYE